MQDILTRYLIGGLVVGPVRRVTREIVLDSATCL
jgi:hypothetical protein